MAQVYLCIALIHILGVIVAISDSGPSNFPINALGTLGEFTLSLEVTLSFFYSS